MIARSDQPLRKKDYVTVLVQFNDSIFSSGERINQSFEEIKEKAFEGSDYGQEKADNQGKYSFYIQLALIAVLILLLKDRTKRLFYRLNARKWLTKKKPRKFKQKYKGEYYRNYPYEENISDIYYLLYTMGASNFEKVLTSFVLKWVKEEKIIVKTEPAGIIRKRDEAALYFFYKDMDKDSPEGELFHMMLKAAGPKSILKASDFSIWAGENVEKLIAWEKKMVDTSKTKLEELGYIQLENKVGPPSETEDYELTSKGVELGKNIHKFANYLRDYSLLNEHEAVNVKIWDEIMIWAALLGLTKVVQKQLEKLYPNYVNESVYTNGSIYYVSAFSNSTSRARVPRYNSSSSGGGSSSSGGGGGSFGGGSGGGTR